jgi:2,4-dienoyl-CoA reductase-like NADH-dependent reductase (Old Yellow Enzyme family)
MSPGRIGTLEVRNRIVHAPMSLSLGEGGGTCGPKFLAYYEARARGGVGLIDIGTVSVGYPEGAVDAKQIALSHDRFIPGIAELARTVQRHGARIMLQLNHNGVLAGLDRTLGRPIAVPSVPRGAAGFPLDAHLPEELEELRRLAAANGPAPPDPGFEVLDHAGIALIVDMFAQAARRAKSAGIDAVEIHGGHGYLLQSFLSSASNRRTDRYGGEAANRSRFLTEAVRAVREETGADFPIVVKLDGVEFERENGITLDDARYFARAAREAGADAVTVTAYADMSRPLNHSGAHTPQQPRLLVPYAEEIGSVTGGPVITAGRIEPEEADRDIRAGRYDFVAMGRKLLADPDLPNRLAAAEPDRVRPCIYCYTCLSQAYFRRPILCPINPEMGHESDVPLPPMSKQVVIVGGGLTGMETARRLAVSGAHVTLFEAASVLGGQARVAARCDEPIARLLAWLTNELERLHVTVRLGCETDEATIRAVAADIVIDARHAIPAGHTSGVVDAADFAALEAQGREIAIIGANAIGLALARFHSARGARIHVIDTAQRAGAGIALVRRWRILRIFDEGAVAHLGVTDLAVGQGSVSFTDRDGNGQVLRPDAVIRADGAARRHAEPIPGALAIPIAPGVRTIDRAFADAVTLSRMAAGAA